MTALPVYSFLIKRNLREALNRGGLSPSAIQNGSPLARAAGVTVSRAFDHYKPPEIAIIMAEATQIFVWPVQYCFAVAYISGQAVLEVWLPPDTLIREGAYILRAVGAIVERKEGGRSIADLADEIREAAFNYWNSGITLEDLTANYKFKTEQNPDGISTIGYFPNNGNRTRNPIIIQNPHILIPPRFIPETVRGYALLARGAGIAQHVLAE